MYLINRVTSEGDRIMILSSKSRYIPLPLDTPTPTLADLKKPNSTIRQGIASTLIRDVQLVLSAIRSSSVTQHDTVYTGLSGGLRYGDGRILD